MARIFEKKIHRPCNRTQLQRGLNLSLLALHLFPVAISSVGIGAEPTATEEITIQSIADAWKNRHDSIDTYRLSASGPLTYPKGWLGRFETGLVPPLDKTFDVRFSLVYSEGRLRYEQKGMHYNEDKSKYVPRVLNVGYYSSQSRMGAAVERASLPAA